MGHDPSHWGDRRRVRVGLLGGSFNPAHAGHRHVAQAALRRLRLDQVWLMVSPGNPLKPTTGMAAPASRLASARRIADGRRIVATDIESRLGTRYTVDTLRTLRRRFPRTRFVWLMGADNLAELPAWHAWPAIFRAVPVAVLARPAYSVKALAGKAARRFSTARRSARFGPFLAGTAPPVWVFLHTRLHPASASAIREGRVGRAG